MAITPQQARQELARRELARREADKPSMIGKAWGALGVPEKMASQGLNQMAQMAAPQQEVTGNLLRDLAANAPKIGLESLAKVAPSFISPESILTAGAAKVAQPLLKGVRSIAKPVGRVGGEKLEEMQGMFPGSLREAYNNAGAMFGKGRKAASPFYEEGKLVAQGKKPVNASGVFDEKGVYNAGASARSSRVDELRQVAHEATDNRKLFDAATELDRSGALEPDVALAARKAMWKIKKSIPDERFYEMLDKFNKVIKANPAMAKADELYIKGRMAESLRDVFPRNTKGTPSIFKFGIAALAGLKGLLSTPVALGAGSTALGLAGRKVISPLIDSPVRAAMTAVSLLKSKREEND